MLQCIRMKKRKVKILIIGMSFVLVVLLTSGFSQASDKLQVRIWADKDQFFVHEPIVVHYELKNMSDLTVFPSFAMIREDFVITDEKGRRHNPTCKRILGVCQRGRFSKAGRKPSGCSRCMWDV